MAEQYAFPMGNPEQGGYDGMTLRDWFAGQALSAVVALGKPPHHELEQYYADVSVASYGIADAMLAARKQDDAQ